eukprot:m.300097 g.300097  ORF g.300097 m.300097 type:complete len:366 (+) comp40791_c1_seq13:7392-8489(+)
MIDLSRTGYVRDQKGVALTDTGISDFTPPWKKPHMSQRRTKEKLLSVLKICGQHGGLFHSASIVFSEDLEHQNTYSSSEESSVAPEEVSGPSTKEPSPEVIAEETEDESDQIIGVLTEFDFLDDEVDDNLELPEPGNPWGVRLRRRSDESQFDAELESTKKSGSLPSIQKAVEMENELEARKAKTPPIDKQRLRATDHTDAGEKSRLASVESVGETEDSNVHRQPTLASEYLPISREETEVMWRAHVATVINDNTGAAAINTFHLFAQLIKATKRRVTKLTKDACSLLTDNWGSITSQFMAMIELLNTHVECPFVYMDTQFITGANLLDQHKFFVMEIHEPPISSKEILLWNFLKASKCLYEKCR